MASFASRIPSFQIPGQIPGLDLTNFDVKKNLETARDNTKRAVELATNLTKDITYVAVGSGVLAFQQVQVRRREMTAAVQSRIPSSLSEVTAAGAAASARATALAESAKGGIEKILGNAVNAASQAVSETIVSVRSRLAPNA